MKTKAVCTKRENTNQSTECYLLFISVPRSHMVCHEVCHELVNQGPGLLWPGDNDDNDNEIGETSEEIISDFETAKVSY